MSGHIAAVVGDNGNGKTLGLTYKYGLKSLQRGRPVVANYYIEEPAEFKGGVTLLTDWQEITELKHCTLLLTEISSAFASRATNQLPPEIVRLLHQFRKPDVDVAWDAVNWARADVVLREATTSVTVAKGYYGDKWLRSDQIPPAWQLNRAKRLDDTGKPMLDDSEWLSNRLFRYLTYNTSAFDEFSVHAIKKLKPIKREWLWRPWHNYDLMYDTLETIPLIENLTDSGICLICGGVRRRPVCHGHNVSSPTARKRAESAHALIETTDD